MGSDGFMCHGMLYWHTALFSNPGSSQVTLQILITYFHSCQPCIIHPSSSILFFCSFCYFCVPTSIIINDDDINNNGKKKKKVLYRVVGVGRNDLLYRSLL